MHTNAHKFVLFLLSRLLCVSTLRSAASSSVSFGFARKVVKKGSSSHRRVSFASTSQKIRAFPCRANPFVPALVHENSSYEEHNFCPTLDSFARSPPLKYRHGTRERIGRGSEAKFYIWPDSGIFAGGKNIFKHRAGEKVLLNGGARGFPV